jgi:hypothetical protein
MRQTKKFFIVKVDVMFNGEKALEYLDCFDTLVEARKTLAEYRLAYGSKAKLDILIKTESSILLGEL